MRSTGNSFKANFLEMNEFPNQKMKKKIIRLYIKLASFFKLHFEQWLSSFHQWLSWTSVGPLKCPINKTMGFPGHLMFRTVPWMQHDINKRPFKSLFFSKWMNPKASNEKNSIATLGKISLLFQTACWSEIANLSPAVQLDFSWIL